MLGHGGIVRTSDFRPWSTGVNLTLVDAPRRYLLERQSECEENDWKPFQESTLTASVKQGRLKWSDDINVSKKSQEYEHTILVQHLIASISRPSCSINRSLSPWIRKMHVPEEASVTGISYQISRRHHSLPRETDVYYMNVFIIWLGMAEKCCYAFYKRHFWWFLWCK